MIALFRHYKGRYVLVYGIAKHVDTLDEYVVYRQLYGNFCRLIKPKEIFLSNAPTTYGDYIPLFRLIFGIKIN